ncbi:MAG: glycerol-3-phosphate 1-O-acyltransferase PlsY [Gemmataceae bacterium]|nr:glycerol-3-phosphate 1-O-acyltransferase PlsY [Gemmataceae bacterium]
MVCLAVSIGLIGASYLIGAIPFGYLLGLARGVNLFNAGSGNIGATNVGRVLGWPYGIAIFIVDFGKGMLPPLVIVPFYLWACGPEDGLDPLWTNLLSVGAAAAAFLGHLFPIYLGFRGGKGIATGAGTLLVLAPEATLVAFTLWGLIVLASRYVSLASLTAACALTMYHLSTCKQPWASPQWPLTIYLLSGSLLVLVKHRSNLLRLWHGHENRLGESRMRQPLLRVIHVLAIGVWFGAGSFFNFLAAPAIFRSFEQVVASAPSDRTANEPLLPPEASESRRKALASALAGCAVGPIFPRYYALQGVCATGALLTALSWWFHGHLHRWRVLVLGLAAGGVLIGWPISDYVSELRAARFSPDPEVARSAQEAFSVWHGYSLLLSLSTTILTGVGLALVAWLPPSYESRQEPAYKPGE